MRFSTVLVAALASTLSLFTSATPVVSTEDSQILARSTSTPVVAIYTDDYINKNKNGLPTAANLVGYNVLILAFLMVKGPVDQAEAYKVLSSSDRTALKKSYNDAGITLMVSAFGSTDAPTSRGVNAATIAKTHAEYVTTYGLQGIDVDYEDMKAIDKHDGKAEQWLITYTQTLRSLLPAGQYLITHAPVAPWFSKSYTAGAYWLVHEKAGDDIDWYNIQFYNQGNSQYTTCTGLFTTSGGDFPKTSVAEINKNAGVPFSKMVVGKPALKGQADSGYMALSTLADCITKSANAGTIRGSMFWEYESSMAPTFVSAITKALAAIGGNNIPVSPGTTLSSSKTKTSTATKTASTATETETDSCYDYTETSTSAATKTTHHVTSTTKSASTSTATSGGSNIATGSCAGVKAWSSTTIYSGGTVVSSQSNTVTYNGYKWTNKWWTQGDEPGTMGGDDAWAKVGSCGSSKRVEISAEVLAARIENATNPRSKRYSHTNRMKRTHLARLNEMS